MAPTPLAERTTAAKYLSITEACERYSVSRWSIYRHIDDGTLPAVRLGRRILRVAEDDLARLFEPVAGGSPAVTRDRAAQQLENYIERVVSEAPPLTNAQRDRLATLLRGGAA